MKIISTIFLILIFFFNGCKTENKKIPGLVIKDALHQAIAKEYLPEVKSLLRSDTLYIICYSRKISPPEEIVSYNKDLENYLPYHVGKWKLIPIDSTFLLNTKEFEYLSISISIIKGDYRVDIISDSRVPSDIINIDRGRLVIIYDGKSEYPIIKDLWYFWG
jgi:hypothetical protein